MTVYQIIDWDHHFENSRSRVIECCSYVAMPNKQHGMGLTRILSAQDGAAFFGIWCLVLQACSRQISDEKQRRAGWLTDNGLPDGLPWSFEDIALRWRQPVGLVERAIEMFVSVKVGWMVRYDETPPSAGKHSCDASSQPSSDVEGKGRELPEQNRREGRESPVTPSPDSGESGDSPQGTPCPDEKTADQRKRLLTILTLNGATTKLGGSEIFHEWCEVCKGYPLSAIEAAFKGKPSPAFPSDLRKILRKMRK
jgi:hypothetical protein